MPISLDNIYRGVTNLSPETVLSDDPDVLELRNRISLVCPFIQVSNRWEIDRRYRFEPGNIQPPFLIDPELTGTTGDELLQRYLTNAESAANFVSAVFSTEAYLNFRGEFKLSKLGENYVVNPRAQEFHRRLSSIINVPDEPYTTEQIGQYVYRSIINNYFADNFIDEGTGNGGYIKSMSRGRLFDQVRLSSAVLDVQVYPKETSSTAELAILAMAMSDLEEKRLNDNQLPTSKDMEVLSNKNQRKIPQLAAGVSASCAALIATQMIASDGIGVSSDLLLGASVFMISAISTARSWSLARLDRRVRLHQIAGLFQNLSHPNGKHGLLRFVL